MYGIYSVIFLIIASLIYYKSSTYSGTPFQINEIQLSKFLVNSDSTIYGTCIDKAVLSKTPLQQIKLSTYSRNTFAILFKHNPYLQCHQLSYAFNFTTTKSKKTHIVLEDLPEVTAIVRDYEIKSLEKDTFLKVKNDQTFVLILYGEQIKQQDQNQVSSFTSNNVILALQNHDFSEPIFKPLLLLGCFNLIGISLIAYYKKNVFNTKVKLLSTVSLLVYLMWIGYETPSSLQQTQEKMYLAMTSYLLIICIKNHLTTCQTSIILAFSVLNQILLSNLQHNYNLDYSLFLWLVYALNFINASFITQGQNIEIVYFSMFGFVIQYGMVNQAIDIMHPLVLSLILVTLLFGSTIFELLGLKEKFDQQERKTKQRLQSYEISQSDTLFRH